MPVRMKASQQLQISKCGVPCKIQMGQLLKEKYIVSQFDFATFLNEMFKNGSLRSIKYGSVVNHFQMNGNVNKQNGRYLVQNQKISV